MTKDDLSVLYRNYIGCLNQQDWQRLGDYVADNVERNGQPVGLAGYREMLQGDFAAIPDLRFTIELLVSDPPCIASRLAFDCAPKGELFGLPVNGKRVHFSENVFYKIADGKIATVWSVIDKAAVETQLRQQAKALTRA